MSRSNIERVVVVQNFQGKLPIKYQKYPGFTYCSKKVKQKSIKIKHQNFQENCF